MIKQYRKKPVVIEAVRWDGRASTNDHLIDHGFPFSVFGNKSVFIETLEGEMRCNIGDWIIKGVNDEFYPCKDEIFQKTYEEVADEKKN